mmetsp:Transcript_23061/g.74206  ORF Transcript_23061/g.74206 Transcript_23061/m.74206 type:complete len:209 (+) Transcript_23061:209-835(+)
MRAGRAADEERRGGPRALGARQGRPRGRREPREQRPGAGDRERRALPHHRHPALPLRAADGAERPHQRRNRAPPPRRVVRRLLARRRRERPLRALPGPRPLPLRARQKTSHLLRHRPAAERLLDAKLQPNRPRRRRRQRLPRRRRPHDDDHHAPPSGDIIPALLRPRLRRRRRRLPTRRKQTPNRRHRTRRSPGRHPPSWPSHRRRRP